MLELYISDIHYPFEDKKSCKLVEQVALDIQPDILFLGGDIGDFYTVSDHLKDPSRAYALQRDLNYQRRALERWRSILPNAKIYYKEGNHETRLTRYLWSKGVALASLAYTRVPKLLDLADLDIQWIENFERFRIGDLWHLHGNEIAGGGAAPASNKLRRTNDNIIFGHLHTEDHRISRAYGGKMVGAWANPCLCDLEPDYIHHAENWSHGFSLINYSDTGLFQVTQVPIIHVSKLKRWAMVSGKEYNV